MNHILPGLLIVGALVIGACQTQSTDPDLRNTPQADTSTPGRRDVPQDESGLAMLKADIEKEIGTPAADNASQCRTIAFGAKPCGGPWSYLVYSTKQSNEARLKQLVAEYNALEDAINKRTGRVSDCMLVGDPGATLENGVCTVARK